MGGIYSKVVNDFGQRRVYYNATRHSDNPEECPVCEVCHVDSQAKMKLCEYCQIEICDNCDTSGETPYNNYILCPTCYINSYFGKRMPRTLTQSLTQSLTRSLTQSQSQPKPKPNPKPKPKPKPKTNSTPPKSESSDLFISKSDDLITCEYCNNHWDGHAQCRCGGNETVDDDI